MNEEEKKTCACPSCQSRFRVSTALTGKFVACKRCGKTFKISFGDADAHEESDRKVAGRGFYLTISEDRLAAYIRPRGEAPEGISFESIKELLEVRGIKYGTVNDAQMAEYVKQKPIPTKPFKIAQGKMPEPTRDSKVKYYFDINPTKIGKVKESGAIDFKDRGEIPQLKKGDLLAEKIPGVEGVPGMDVFGEAIPVPNPKDINPRCGKGAEMSEDKLKVFAKFDGRPELSFDGKVAVLAGLKISGDVGLETGHVEFDGNIEVNGAIQDGFRVTGKRLTANEILKAEIDIEGDIVVLGGIIGAHIRTTGKLRARYVRGAEIEALDDVVVEKEIMDSKIETNGICAVQKGKMLSSWVSAKKGIEAHEIGSEASKPCMLVIGFSKSTRNEVEKIEEKIQQKRQEQEEYRTPIKELDEKSDRIEAEIGKLAQIEDSATVEQRTMREKMEELRKANDKRGLAKTEKTISDLDLKIKQIKEPLDKLLDKRDQIVEKIAGFENKIKSCEEEIKEFQGDIKALSESSQKEKQRPTVKVNGTIFSHATIKGPHATIILRENLEHACIRESRILAPDSSVIWDMDISRL